MSGHQTVPQRAELTLARYIRNPRPTILDVGANRGQSHVRFRALFPEARRIGLLQLELIPAAFYDRIATFSDIERWLLPHGYRLMTINRIVTDDEGLMRACDVLYGLQRSELN